MEIETNDTPKINWAPTPEQMDNFDKQPDIGPATVVFWENSGLDRYHELDALTEKTDSLPDGENVDFEDETLNLLINQTIECIKSNNLPTDSFIGIENLVKAFKLQMAAEQALFMCGACGVRMYTKPHHANFKYQNIYRYHFCELAELDLLRLNEQQELGYRSLDEMTRTISSVYCSLYLPSNPFFYLHPETVEVVEKDNERIEKVYVCGSCYYMINKEGKSRSMPLLKEGGNLTVEI